MLADASRVPAASNAVITILEQAASGGGKWNPGTGYGVLDVAAAVARAVAAKTR